MEFGVEVLDHDLFERKFVAFDRQSMVPLFRGLGFAPKHIHHHGTVVGLGVWKSDRIEASFQRSYPTISTSVDRRTVIGPPPPIGKAARQCLSPEGKTRIWP